MTMSLSHVDAEDEVRQIVQFGDQISRIADLEQASSEWISFLSNKQLKAYINQVRGLSIRYEWIVRDIWMSCSSDF